MQTSVQNGSAKTVVSAAVTSALVKEAAADQSKNVVIKPEITGDVSKTEVSIPASTMRQLKSATSADLTVSTPVADVTIPNTALSTLSSAGGNVSVMAEQKVNSVAVTLTAGGKEVKSVPGGLTVTVPVENATPGTVAVLVHKDGARETIRKSIAGDGKLNIPLDGSATVEIVDIAGLVKGASKGEGLGNKFLANIRETDAIIHVLRCFDDDNITHVDGSVNPVRDKEIIDYELLIKDLETVESRLARTLKQAQTGGDKVAKMQYQVLSAIKEALDHGLPARSVSFDSPDEQKFARELFLLTSKPVLYVCNVDDASAASGNAYVEAVREAIANEGAGLLVVAAATESEIAELDTYEERQEFLAEIGLQESGVSRLIRAAYSLLDLQTFFTAGSDEVRAWTFRRGSKAPRCAGIIHTDFEKGFIRAEVIKYDDFVTLGGESAVREAGKMAVEGKEYVVADGDIMHFRFNV